MQTAKKPKATARSSNATKTARAKSTKKSPAVDWSKGTITRGDGVAATIAALRRTRGPNKNPTKEQVAIRLDRKVLQAFRAGGPGWQTRVNAALKEWLNRHSSTH